MKRLRRLNFADQVVEEITEVLIDQISALGVSGLCTHHLNERQKFSEALFLLLGRLLIEDLLVPHHEFVIKAAQLRLLVALCASAAPCRLFGRVGVEFG